MIRPIERRDEDVYCDDPLCEAKCARRLTTAHNRWGTAAASHQWFIKETRKGHSGVVNLSKHRRLGPDGHVEKP